MNESEKALFHHLVRELHRIGDDLLTLSRKSKNYNHPIMFVSEMVGYQCWDASKNLEFAHYQFGDQ